MQIIIDGYNLLHAIGFAGNLAGHGKLEQARISMLNKLGKYLTLEERNQTKVIFDSGHRSREKPKKYELHGIQVMFSFDFEDADSMIVAMIDEHPSPEMLFIVSSDHQIQKAARRRKVEYCDSDVWIDELESREFELPDQSGLAAEHEADEKPINTDEETSYWMTKFAGDEVDKFMDNEQADSNSTDSGSSDSDLTDSDLAKSNSDDLESEKTPEIDNIPSKDYDIFPPGYGEELL